jgi:putative spermidine/putrescine transport system ATP-binding protein
VTTVFVTHDQSEALAMSDQIVVMSEGRVEQVGPPEEVYNAPATEFVARFLGAANIFEPRARRRGGRRGGRASADLRPARRARAKAPKLPAPAPPSWWCAPKSCASRPRRAGGRRVAVGVVETVDYQGQAARYFVRAGDMQLQAINMIDDHPFAEGAPVSMPSAPARLRGAAGGLNNEP